MPCFYKFRTKLFKVSVEIYYIFFLRKSNLMLINRVTLMGDKITGVSVKQINLKILRLDVIFIIKCSLSLSLGHTMFIKMHY